MIEVTIREDGKFRCLLTIQPAKDESGEVFANRLEVSAFVIERRECLSATISDNGDTSAQVARALNTLFPFPNLTQGERSRLDKVIDSCMKVESDEVYFCPDCDKKMAECECQPKIFPGKVWINEKSRASP